MSRKSWLKFKDRRAVSEILANILILGITVVLFSTVIGFVSTVPEPDDPVRVEMSATLDGDILTITHKGGSTLQADPSITRVRIDADGVVAFVPLQYGTTSNDDPWDKPWSVGNTWKFNFSNAPNNEFITLFDPEFNVSVVSVSVTYISQGNAIWSATLKTDSDNPPRITNFRITGQNSSGTTIGFQDTVTLRVTVKDSDGDMGTVVGNLNSLFKENVPSTPFDDRVGPETWEVTITPTADNGSKIISITATDLEGNTDREFYQINIVSEETTVTPTNPPGPTEPTEPTDPTIPGGGDPVESPPNFFQLEMNYDFFIFAKDDWDNFKQNAGPGIPTPTIKETLSYNVTESFYLVFKIKIDGGVGPKNAKSGEIKIENPTNLFNWDNYIYYSGGQPWTNAITLTNETGVTFEYSQHLINLDSLGNDAKNRFLDNGGKVYATLTTGQGVGNQKTWYGHGMINPFSNEKIVVSSINLSAQNTKYFKSQDQNMIINVNISDGAGKQWWPQGVWEGSFHTYNQPQVSGPVKIYNQNGQIMTYPNDDGIPVSKDGDYDFRYQLSRGSFNSVIQTGWNTLYVEVTYMIITPDGSNAYKYAHGYKFYVQS